MKPTHELVSEIVERFRARGYAQVEGYKRFGFIRETPNAVVVSRETGQPTPIPHAKIVQAVEAVRSDPAVYDAGPSFLRDHGITHLNSPIWALLHLLTLAELSE